MCFNYEQTPLEYQELIERLTSRYGLLDVYKFNRIIEVMQNTLIHYKRVRAFRIDLRFASDYSAGDVDSPVHFQQADPKAITRFIDSLKSQLKVHRKHKRIFSKQDDFKYVWVREKDESFHHHYHLVLFFNRDIYYPLGNYSSDESSGLAALIQKAWCSALQVYFPDYAYLVHFPDNCAYNFDRKSATLQDEKYVGALERFLYLAKVNTKTMGDGYRNFGCSQF